MFALRWKYTPRHGMIGSRRGSSSERPFDGTRANENALIAAAEAGDRVALQQLLLNALRCNFAQIAAELPAKNQMVVSVEDVLQQTLTQAVRDFDQRTERNAESFSSWLVVIAEHRVQEAIKDHGRLKRGGNRRQVAASGDRPASTIVDLVELLSDHRPSPSKQVAAAEAVHAVQVGVADLAARSA